VSTSSLSPIGWQCPDGPLYPFAGSIAVLSREFSLSTTMQCTRSKLLENVVLGFEDLSTFSLGCTVYDGQIFPTSCPLVTSDVAAILDSISMWFIGTQGTARTGMRASFTCNLMLKHAAAAAG
jgi:hypothetical protein